MTKYFCHYVFLSLEAANFSIHYMHPQERATAEDNESCIICMDDISNPMTLVCGHRFCTECIDQQFSFKKACPTCGRVCGVIEGMNYSTLQ